MALKFRNVDLSSLHFRLIEIEEELLPNMTNDTIRNPSGVGEIIMQRTMQARYIKLIGRVIASTKQQRNERLQALSSVLINADVVQLEDGKLELPDRSVFYKASLNGITPIESFMNSADIEIGFICADPLAYGEEKTVPAATVTIDCNYSVLPVFTVTPPSVIGGFLIVTENGKMEVVTSIPANSTLIIDHVSKNATLNGVSVKDKITFDSDFFEVATGTTKFVTSVPPQYVQMKYRERWLF